MAEATRRRRAGRAAVLALLLMATPVAASEAGDRPSSGKSPAHAPPAILWNVTFDGGGFDAANGIDVGRDGHPVVTGESCTPGATTCDFRTIKYDRATGAVRWNVTFDSGDGRDNEAFGVAVGADRHPVVTGFSCLPDGSECDIRTIKYHRATGAVRWNVTFDTGGATNEDRAFGIAIGADLHPVVTGLACDAGFTTCVLRTIKYNGATGAILWKRTFTERPFEIGSRVAIGPDHNPVVTGVSCVDFFASCVIRTIKYKGGTGELLWTAVFDSGREDIGLGVGIGDDGHPVVGGSTCPGPGVKLGCDFRVIKYNGRTGAVIWNVTLNSGGANFDEVESVAVGPGGHPVVAGQSCSPEFSQCDFRTMKLDARTGAVRWNTTFAGPGDFDAAFGVAIGRDGHPVVTGISCTAYPACDFRTLKYVAPREDDHDGR